MKQLPGIQASRGCTEPVAIALAAALAARAATGTVRSVTVHCDGTTLKNAQSSGIPSTGGQKGAALAAALGALAGDPERGLELLSSVSAEDVERARGLLAADAVQVELRGLKGRPRLWVEARVVTDVTAATARLEDTHTRLVELEAGGVAVPRPAWATTSGPRADPAWDGWSLAQVVALADGVDAEDARALLAGLHTNLQACGWEAGPPTRAELSSRAETLAESGSLARMEGRGVTVVTSGFSGNQGLVASIPVWVVAGSVGADDEGLARALAISHLVGSYVRSFTGILSPLCNAVQAASAGAAAGCVRLLGGGLGEIERAAKRVLATSGGVVCDGAKPACSLKVGLGAAQAIRAAQRVLAGTAIETSDGLAGDSLEQTARILGRVAYPGMERAGQVLLEAILSKSSGGSVAPPD